jgi:hypothetical protein
MAKITETTVIPEPVVPPRTFTVELNEEEFNTLFVLLATTVPHTLSQTVERVADPDGYYNDDVKAAAQSLIDGGNKNITHDLYDDIAGYFNG